MSELFVLAFETETGASEMLETTGHLQKQEHSPKVLLRIIQHKRHSQKGVDIHGS
jgi:hypothetical protein